jgi:regulator of replication initiation timing
MQTWTEEELKELIQYTQHLRMENEDLQAKMIMMNAKLENEEKKNKKLQNILNLLAYGQRNDINNPN